MQSLAKDPNFAGVKECTGNKRIHGYSSQGLSVWSGNDDEAHDGRWEHGARGVSVDTWSECRKLGPWVEVAALSLEPHMALTVEFPVLLHGCQL
jgi:hypothetical protein